MNILDAKRSDTLHCGRSFTLSNRLYRLAWSIAWLLLASWTPPQLHGWRRLLLRAFGASLATGTKVYPSARIWSPANLTMDDHAVIGRDVVVYSMGPIRLESYALVSQGAHLCAGTHDIEDTYFQLQARPIVIGPRAWIAAEAFVGPGVIVGRGAVLGARGCAFRDLEPWTIYAGNPAKPLKPRRVRFPELPE